MGICSPRKDSDWLAVLGGTENFASLQRDPQHFVWLGASAALNADKPSSTTLLHFHQAAAEWDEDFLVL